MSTFLSEFLNQVDSNWLEIDIILAEANRVEKSNPNLYSVLCRSATVLLVTHLEGFIKGLVKAIIADHNDQSNFLYLPDALKRTYCRKYLGDPLKTNDKAYNKRALFLIDKFSSAQVKISHDPFLFGDTTNPKPDAIEKITARFGIKKVFSHFHNSQFDDVFSDSMKQILEAVKLEWGVMVNSVESYPYQNEIPRLKLQKTEEDVPKRTLWQEFLDQTNFKRHSVVHGNEFSNMESVDALALDKAKIQYFQLGLVALLTSVAPTTK